MMMENEKSDRIQIEKILTSLDFIKEKVDDSNKKIDDLDKKIGTNYVTNEQLDNVKLRVTMLEKITYGLVGIVLTAVVVAIVSLVLIK